MTVVCVVATVGALTIDLLSYQSFLLMLGSFFVPLFGVLLADWLAAGARYGERDVFAGPSVRWGMLAAWIAGFALYQWLHPSGRPGGPTRSATAPAWTSARRCRASPSRSRSGWRWRRSGGAGSRVRAVRGVAVIGNIALDTIAGGRPRVGGAPYHAARALRLLGGGSRIVARSAESDRRALVAPLAALGVQWTWLAAPSTTTFEIRYHGEEREMSIGDPGSPWTLEDARAVGRADWVQVGGADARRLPAGRARRSSPATAGSRSTGRRSFDAPGPARSCSMPTSIRPCSGT